MQFVEIKGSVFKKFEKNNLFQMSNSGMYIYVGLSVQNMFLIRCVNLVVCVNLWNGLVEMKKVFLMSSRFVIFFSIISRSLPPIHTTDSFVDDSVGHVDRNRLQWEKNNILSWTVVPSQMIYSRSVFKKINTFGPKIEATVLWSAVCKVFIFHVA